MIGWPQANPSVTIFDELQAHVFTMMKDDSLPRFVQSQHYSDLVAKKDAGMRLLEVSCLC